MEFFSHFSPEVKAVFDAIRQAGGDAYVVGGYVRDEWLKLKGNKDIDVEVYGLEPQHLHIVLKQFGKTEKIGRSFSVFKLGCLPNFDFALARKETKTGDGHRDFSMEYLTERNFKEACKRRDLTINSILLDPYSGELIDPNGGIQDLENKVIRFIDEKTFKEDPLRVLRVARMQAKLPDFHIDPDTKQVCAVMKDQLVHLSTKRIFQEYSKLLLSVQPSLGLSFLFEIKALIKPLPLLAKTIQRADFHPEGNVWNHTLLVVDLAALCKDKTVNPLGFMWSALLHDIGKPSVTTAQGKAPNHDLIGEPLAYQFMYSLSCNKELSTYVSLMVRCHMVLMNASRQGMKSYPYLKVLKRLEGRVHIDDLALLCICDKMGRARIDRQSIENFNAYIDKMKKNYGMIALPPLICGQDLKALGYLPGPAFSTILEDAYDQQLSGNDKQQLINYILSKYER
ncbi:CCA tRNA nucleotidyltransferase [Beduini massiliensis]|uniref:CCA tRNA nucleotidyltransferase n=1 Tax=Beduini massiliensis TaxID=1585974 RepID=UPI00059A9972|nr:HD domain-containing protein [Beduini massiliensis]